jgi:Rad/Gem-related GTP binding protein 1
MSFVFTDEDACDRSVSVLLDGEESQLIFIDHPHGEISVSFQYSRYYWPSFYS